MSRKIMFNEAKPTRVLAFFLVAASLPAQLATVQVTRAPQGTQVPNDFIGISIEDTIGQIYFGTPSRTELSLSSASKESWFDR